MNSYLREIAAFCGIQAELTFHIARHTFATTITLNNGVPIESVSKMMGHTNIKQTQLYGELQNYKVSNDMQLLGKNLCGRNNLDKNKKTIIKIIFKQS
jgi:site-specific recombinase XerD